MSQENLNEEEQTIENASAGTSLSVLLDQIYYYDDEETQKKLDEFDTVKSADIEKIFERQRPKRKIVCPNQELKNLPLNQYLTDHVLPILTDGFIKLAEVKPDKPIDFLINYYGKNKNHNLDSEIQNKNSNESSDPSFPSDSSNDVYSA